jgi:predicted DNA-binding transcriptional regulator YafY
VTRKRTESDRRLRQALRVARILRVLELIQGRGRWNAQALAGEIECSERTIYRDLEALELAGVPWYYDETEQCYRVRPDCRFPVLSLTEEETVGQAVATALSGGPGLKIGPGAKPATRKLAAISNERTQQLLADAEQLVHVLDLKIADHSRHLDILRTVQWALLHRKQVVGQYRSPYEADTVQLRLYPYRLCLIKNAWYLIGRPTDSDQPRTFRVARFKTLRLVDQPADIPEDFDLRSYFGNAWAVYRGEQTYDIEILFSPEAAEIVTETTWHHSQRVKRHKDGSVTLFFKVDGLNEIVRWVLGWAGRAKVIKPPELRKMVTEQHRKAIEMNDEN